MKNNITLFLLLLLFINGFSQNYTFEYSGRFTPAIKKEKLNFAKSISEIMPEFSRHFRLAYNDQYLFDQLLEQQKTFLVNHQLIKDYPQEIYSNVIDFVVVEISAICNGKTKTFKSANEILTTEQKNILNTADLGTNITIKINFKYKNQLNQNLYKGSKIKVGTYVVTVIPETEAEYPGGFKQFSTYFIENAISKIQKASTSEKIQQAILNFTINEQGQIVDAKIFRSSSDAEIDKLLLDAIHNMPKWKPAKNSNGIKVKQEFSIPFGGGGC